jgi:hypothetical protein
MLVTRKRREKEKTKRKTMWFVAESAKMFQRLGIMSPPAPLLLEGGSERRR